MKIKKNKKKLSSFGKLVLKHFSWSHWSHRFYEKLIGGGVCRNAKKMKNENDIFCD
jgi:hypothetical protein